MLAAVLGAACGWLCLASAPTYAQIAFTPCAGSTEFACGHLTVPLDPSGAVPGTVTLALRRHRATVGEAHSAIIALAGGPGQSAIPFAETFSELLGAAGATRDLIVFDQRGIGFSQPLSCHALERPGLFHSNGALIEACASQLGPARADYTTANTVADIEAIRVAGGYEKLVLYGTSYGTKVAELYAQDYPTHVEALVLDSVVPPNGPEPLNRPTFAALPRVLAQICADRACAHITANPFADLTRVVRRSGALPLIGRVIDGQGKAHLELIFPGDIYGLLLAGDFSPVLRAELVTALSAAAKGDPAALARLTADSGGGEDEQEDFDTPLYYATTCEEQDFPWNRAVDPNARLAEATAAARALPASTFAPFSAAEAIELSDAASCAHWPFTAPAPPSDSLPFPNVPTLILSGADDLRTPTANAREVAAQIPDAQLLIVPYTGHSVLTDERTNCGREALQALFASGHVKPCRALAPPPAIRPPPLPPRRLALVTPAGGAGGLPGRTVHAADLTLAYLFRQLAFQLEQLIDSGELQLTLPTLRTGGLRAGWAGYANGRISLHGYSYVPGMTVSGTLVAGAGALSIAGSSAAAGTLHVGAGGELSGALGGHAVRLLQSPGATAAIVGDDAAPSSHSPAQRAVVRSAVRELDELLGGSRP